MAHIVSILSGALYVLCHPRETLSTIRTLDLTILRGLMLIVLSYFVPNALNLRRRCFAAALAPGEDGMPRGWVKRRDWFGRTYYFDLLTWQSLRTKPRSRPLYEPLQSNVIHDGQKIHIRIAVLVPNADAQSPPECIVVATEIMAGLVAGRFREFWNCLTGSGSLPYYNATFRREIGFCDALSYCWGDPHITDEIILNGRRKQATTNLIAALRQFRANSGPQPTLLWVDAICINQEDVKERSEQVIYMGMLYFTAPIVHVWLGPFDSISPGLRFLERISDNTETGEDEAVTRDEEEALRASKMLAEVVRLPYWNRKWVIQELALAERVVLHCGKWHTAPLDCEKMLLRMMSEFATPEDNLITKAILGLLYGRDLYKSTKHGSYTEIEGDGALPRVIYWLRFSSASVPHDGVYAFLRMFGELIELRPDYDLPVLAVFTDATVQLIRNTNCLDLLQQACSQRADFPSWVLEFSEPPPKTFLHDRALNDPRCDASAVTTGQISVVGRMWQVLRVPALFIGTVSIVSQPLIGGCGHADDRLGSEREADRVVVAEWNDLVRQHSTSADQESFWEDFCEIHLWTHGESEGKQRANCDRCIRYLCALSNGEEPDPVDRRTWCEFVFATDCFFHSPQHTVLFITTEGRFGFVRTDAKMQIGDSIFIIALSSMPFCVKMDSEKSKGKSVVRLKGPVYVDGVMDGEAVKAEARSRFGAEENVNDVFEDMLIR